MRSDAVKSAGSRVGTLTLKQDRRLVRHRWHSRRFVVAHVAAPHAIDNSERPPVNLAFVIDRSGSMAGGALELATQAVEEGIARLKPSDRFSLVVYDDQIDTVESGAWATEDAKQAAILRLRDTHARGTTDLSGGWLRGCEHVATALVEAGVNRCLLLTDGLANRGITSIDQLRHHAGELRQRGISTSTFGVGDHFDEVLMQAMAQAGGGHFYDIATEAQIRDHIESEVGETLEIVARDVVLMVTFPDTLQVESLGAFEGRADRGRARILLGDLVSGQELDVPLRITFPSGDEGDTLMLEARLDDADGVFEGTVDRAAWELADDRANDRQARDLGVDRSVAAVFAARARRKAGPRPLRAAQASCRALLRNWKSSATI